MGLLEGYIKIENDTQLAYYEHVLQNLAAKEVSALFIVDNITAIIALLISVGAMVVASAQDCKKRDTNTKNSKEADTDAKNSKEADTEKLIFGIKPLCLIVIAVLVGVLYYAVYAEYTHRKEKQELPKMISITQDAIECYKKTKDENK